MMAEQPLSCPFCGGPANVGPTWAWCTQCAADMTGDDAAEQWRRRTPGPATRAMLEKLASMPPYWREMAPPLANKAEVLGKVTVADIFRFLAEWPEPTPTVAPVPDTGDVPIEPADEPERSPWHCAICGKPVRLTNDLQPWHLDGPANHEAELSREQLKTLADGLRMSD